MSKVDKNNPECIIETKEKVLQNRDDTTNECTNSQQSEIDFEELKIQASKKDTWDIMVKISYQDRNKYLDYNPKNLKELKEQIIKLFSVSNNEECKWNYFYFDSHYDRVDILHTRDLKLAYKVNLHIHSKVLKIYVWDDDLELPEFNDIHGWLSSDNALQNNFQPSSLNQINNSNNYSSVSSTIIRKQEVQPCSEEQPCIPCSIPQKANTTVKPEVQRPMTINDQFKSLQSLSAEDLNTLNEIKQGIVSQLKKNIEISKDDIVKELKKTKKFLSLIDTQEFFIQHIYNETKKKLLEIQARQRIIVPPIPQYKQEESASRFDIKTFKTLRGTSFGRMLVELKEENKLIKLNFLVSDFEIQILRTNQDDGQNVYIECGIKTDSGEYKASLNFYIYDCTTKLYMPIGHWLISDKCKNAYIAALNWFKKELGTFFKPKMLFWDFEFDLYDAIKIAFWNIQVSVLFNRLTRGLYELAKQYKLFDDIVTDRVKSLILCLKWASLSPPGKVKENFDKIKAENSSYFADINEHYDKFMNYFEKNYTSTFKLTDWWNQSHVKLVCLDQIKVLSKTDEAIWKIYKSLVDSLLSSEDPSGSNLFNFLKLLQWLENTIKTTIFDKAKSCSENKIFDEIPFTKNIDYLMECDYIKVLNFEESNDDLYDSKEVLESFGFKSQTKKAKEIIIAPSIESNNVNEFENYKDEESNEGEEENE